jgi:hypothetical protein
MTTNTTIPAELLVDLHERLGVYDADSAAHFASVWGWAGTTAKTDGLNGLCAVLILWARHRAEQPDPLLVAELEIAMAAMTTEDLWAGIAMHDRFKAVNPVHATVSQILGVELRWRSRRDSP